MGIVRELYLWQNPKNFRLHAVQLKYKGMLKDLQNSERATEGVQIGFGGNLKFIGCGFRESKVPSRIRKGA